LGSVGVPLLLSFDKRLQFYKKWPIVLPAIAIVAVVYISFDVYLTHKGVWGFNPRYLSGIQIINLPLEEWLFFIVIAYASLFLHYSVVEYFPQIKLNTKASTWISTFLILFSIVMVVANINRAYTSYIFIKMIFALLLAVLWRSKSINSFFITFLVILIPFVVVNGILTGSFIDGEVVWYDNTENLSIRFFTIPVEDFAYAFTMLLFNLILIDKLKEKRGIN
jgi:lycopene cyclase domain-containing protein